MTLPTRPPSCSLKRTLLLGIDPGEMTGTCLFDLANRELLAVGAEPASVAVQGMWSLMSMHAEHLEIAYERFTISQHTLRLSPQLDALQVIGAIRFAAEPRDIPFCGYTVSESKSFSTDAKLARFKLRRQGPDHVRDAARIVLLHVSRKHPKIFKDMLNAAR